MLIQELLSATGKTQFALNIFDSASIAAIKAELADKKNNLSTSKGLLL